MTNTSNLPVEALELEYPLTLLRYELVDGSGGRWPPARRHGPAPRLSGRGGLPLEQPRQFAPEVAALGARRRRAEAARGGFVFSEGVGILPQRVTARLRPGQIVEIITPGAGGYGPFSLRSAAAV
jgi:N-methylhydantoinase B